MKDRNIIHVGDALAMIRQLPDSSVDLIIADPPYSLAKDREFGEGAYFESRETWLAWCKTWLREAARVLKPKGNLLVYAIHHNACFLQVYLYELGLVYRRQIIWNYENGWSKYRNGPACHYEPILWFAHQNDSTYHVIREPYKSEERLRHKITKNGKVWTPHPDGRQGGDVWRIPTLAGRRFANERTEHPTQKPLALSHRLVKHFSNPGEVVLVPFAGSGSECVAAVQAGRQFVAAEINPTFADIAQRRIVSASVELTEEGAKDTLSDVIGGEAIPIDPSHADPGAV